MTLSLPEEHLLRGLTGSRGLPGQGKPGYEVGKTLKPCCSENHFIHPCLSGFVSTWSPTPCPVSAVCLDHSQKLAVPLSPTVCPLGEGQTIGVGGCHSVQYVLLAAISALSWSPGAQV
jgi:hypothetical protein